MNDNTIREVASIIFNGQIIYNLKFYLLFFALIVLSNVASSYLISYFKKRGESKAIHDDFERLFKELKINTEAIAKINSKISHSEWKKKENIVLRRSKLEELMACVYDLSIWLEKETQEKMFKGDKNSNPNPIYKIKLIGGLYFQELNDDIGKIYSTSVEYQQWILERWQDRLENINRTEAMGEFAIIHKKLLDNTNNLERRIIDIMDSILNSDSVTDTERV